MTNSISAWWMSAGLLGLVGCGSDAPTDLARRDAGRANAPSMDAGAPPVDAASDGPPPCVDGTRLSCACANDQVGARLCLDGSYGECSDCQDTSGEPVCVEGYYEGRAVGSYRASGPLGDLFAPFDNDSDTKIAFTLEKKANGEFFTLGNACVHVTDPNGAGGNADATGVAFYLTGQLDCLTGLLEGEMRGYHWNGMPDSGKRYFYKGKIVGRFDPETGGFVDTAYKIIERPPLLGDPAGGQGTWTAELQANTSAPSEVEQTVDACLGEPFPDDNAFAEVEL